MKFFCNYFHHLCYIGLNAVLWRPAPDLCFCGLSFESRPRDRFSWPRTFVGFVNPSIQVLGYYL